MATARAPGRDELTAHLVAVVGSRLLDPLEILLDPDGAEVLPFLRHRVAVRAAGWADDMLGPDDTAAARTAMRLIYLLQPDDRPFDPPAHWWGTPLGQVVARRLGHPTTDHVSYPVAGAMLGMTRQGVHDLVSRGKLARHADGGVTVASVRARLHGGSAPGTAT